LSEEAKIAAELDRLDAEIDSDKAEPEMSPSKAAAKQAAASGEYSLLHPEFTPRKGGKTNGGSSSSTPRRHKLIEPMSITVNDLKPLPDTDTAQLRWAIDTLTKPFDSILVEKAALSLAETEEEEEAEDEEADAEDEAENDEENEDEEEDEEEDNDEADDEAEAEEEEDSAEEEADD